ncbi:hypothetical protein N7G274_006509 [Stereocaulon virgatum]|uniref:Uncharacterized protein n=1 Tax=Stereocaulon virgatum TaxID=373712 RepID=A0ABR4A632_9LECA
MASLALDIKHCCRPCLRRLYIQKRSLTTTTSRRKHGAVPIFSDTPSPELNALLSTFRTNIFLPSHLIKLQRDLLYKKKNHSLLTAEEPATVRLGNEVHQLLPLNHITDEPATRASIAKVVKLMTETGDWKNLPGFLEGLKTARRVVHGDQFEKMIRRASDCGRIGVVVDCLRRVERTGMGLWDVRVAREVMWGVLGKCVQSEWSEEGVESGRKLAEVVWELCFDPKHVPKMVGLEDPKKRPEIAGVLVQMYAAKAVMFEGSKDEGGAVEKWVQLMLRVWGNTKVGVKERDWNDANYQLTMWAPVWHGILMAQKLLGAQSPLGQELGAKLQELESVIQQARLVLSEHPHQDGNIRRGLKVYNQLSQVSV